MICMFVSVYVCTSVPFLLAEATIGKKSLEVKKP